MRPLALLGLLVLGSVSDERGSDPPLLALTDVNVIDGLSRRPKADVTIIIAGKRIEAIQSSRKPIPGGARVIDLEGAWVIPGLIDMHVHLRDEGSARRALRSGVTTARSMGVDGFVDVEMARQHAAGASDLPDIIAAGYHVRPRLAEAFFGDFPVLAGLRQGVTSDDSVREVVRANAGRGVRVVKVMATQRAGTTDTDFRLRALGDGELAAATAEARKFGLPVAAHAHTDEGVRASILAGARSIEHGTAASTATLGLMRARDVCLVPTLSFWADMAGPGGEYDHPVLAARGRSMFPIAKRTVLRARQAKVAIAAGSDMRYDRTSSYGIVDELLLLRESGLTPPEAIHAATVNAATCLGIASRTGSLRAGLEADLLVLDRNPNKDLSTLRRPRMVINDGAIVERDGGPV